MLRALTSLSPIAAVAFVAAVLMAAQYAGHGRPVMILAVAAGTAFLIFALIKPEPAVPPRRR
jgi:formate-dependent nitrite reductase membrane component NrfD